MGGRVGGWVGGWKEWVEGIAEWMDGWRDGGKDVWLDGSKLKIFGRRHVVDGLSAAGCGGGCGIFGGNVARCTENKGNAITKTPKSRRSRAPRQEASFNLRHPKQLELTLN